MQRWNWMAPPSQGRRLFGIADDMEERPMEDHPLRFREFLAAELAALEEKLATRFELGELGAPTRSWRRESNDGLFRREQSAGPVWKRCVSVGSVGSGWRRQSSDDEVLETRSAWERIVVRLLAAKDPVGFGIAEMVSRITQWRCDDEEDSATGMITEEAIPEELVTPHPMWMSQMGSHGKDKHKRPAGTQNIFAMSRVGEGGSSAKTQGEDYRPRAGGIGKWIVIHPDSIFRYMWTFVGAMFLMHDLFTIPMEAVKLWDEGWASRLMEVTIAYWSADLLCQSLMGYHMQNHIEMRPTRTLRHYAATWMPLDAAVLLLDIAFYLFRFSSTARSIRILKLLRLVRLTRLHKWVLALRSIMKSNTSELADLLVKVGRLMFLLVCHCHFTACAWYGIAEAFEDAERPPGSTQNWVEENALSGQSHFLCYVVALHWSITQFTPATNNVVPVNGAERTFAVLVVLLGFVAFSAFLSSMMGALGQLKSLKQSQVRERQQLLHFFRNKRVPAGLADRVLRLFDAEGELKRDSLVEDDLPVLACLPISIRLRIRREYCLPLLQMNEIFDGVYPLDRRCFLQIIFDGMADKRYNAQQEVFVDGLESNSMYVVSLGKLKYHQRGALTSLELGEWVSEASLYVTQWVHQGSLVAKTCSIMTRLDCRICRKVVMQTGGDLFRTLRCCAVMFAHKLESSVERGGCLSDLGPTAQDRADILERSLRICNVGPRKRSTVHSEEIDVAPVKSSAFARLSRRSSGRTSTATIDSDDED